VVIALRVVWVGVGVVGIGECGGEVAGGFGRGVKLGWVMALLAVGRGELIEVLVKNVGVGYDGVVFGCGC